MTNDLLNITTSFNNYDFITWYVSNAKQAAAFYINQFGFSPEAYQGLETNSRDISVHVVKLGSIRMIFKSALRGSASSKENEALVEEIHAHVKTHGDGVKDVAFSVDDVVSVYLAAINSGAKSIQEPSTISDEFGSVTTAVIGAYGDTTHTLIDRSQYFGTFLPGFKLSAQSKQAQMLDEMLGGSGLVEIDHCVANQGWNKMEEVCQYYEKTLGFHRFWSVDDNQICTEYSALRSIVMASPNEKVKMPVNEPAVGKKKSQIEEFVEFYNGPGVQHIALRTDNIIETIQVLRRRGVEFIVVPQTYYDQLRDRLEHSKVKIMENLKDIQKLDILVDFDDNGYLLQLFTKPLVDRPTVFFEIIQRNNFDGFGVGNFKALFEAIEREQEIRGTL